jgi:hypothetical protein
MNRMPLHAMFIENIFINQTGILLKEKSALYSALSLQ